MINQTQEPKIQHHVAVLAFPFGTHAAPLLSIVRRLAAAVPPNNTTVFSFFNTCHSNSSIFSSAAPNDNIKPYNVSDGVPEGYQFQGKPQEKIELFVKAAPQSFREAFDVAVRETGKEVTCLLTDAFFWFAADMAQEMRVPWLSFWTAGPTSLSAHLYTDLIRSTLTLPDANYGPPSNAKQKLEFIPGLSKVEVQDLPEGIVFGNLDSIFPSMLHQMGQVLPRATLVFINSFEELDTTITQDLKSKLKKFLNVGPLNLASPPPPSADVNGCIPWLEKQKASSVAYISFGSVMVPPPEELVAIAEALQGSGVPFIWSLRENSWTHLPKGFVEERAKKLQQGMVVSWAPQTEILSHGAVGVFVTHCGWNSLLESIEGGVPMICRPSFGDQRLNARMVQDGWEIGVGLEEGGGEVTFTRDAVLKSLDLVLNQERGKRMRERIKALNQLAKQAVGPKGSSADNFKTLFDDITSPPVQTHRHD
ncbi:anthocyanidin 3-O-glucosyltransferase UFGT [Ziziphus jujuba]|uniref:Glycosyltransferase n=1 Tax=Ziziphus jujuba TaxID=326968 RepID=A0A6P3ZJC0_ZIZJJ|nr:anthocyanidin 3-O-glucosyltransferase UFGT [Ziziphus jujuba]